MRIGSDSFDVTIALNGKTAMQKAIWHRPAVILLDVVMPDMGGYEVVRLLQSTPQTQDIPLIVMTAKNYDDSTIRMIKAERNVFGFINKPFKPSELIKMIGLVLAGSRTFAPESSTLPAETKEAPAPPARIPGGPLEVTLGGAVPAAPPPAEVVMARRAVDQSSGSRGTERPAPASVPDNDLPGGAPRSILRRVLGKAARFVGGLLILGSAFFAVGEWTSRCAEEALGAKFFVPPIYPASRVNSFLPYQWNPTNANPIFWDDGRVVYQLNRWGLRGPDFPLVAPDGVTRILLLGDLLLRTGPGGGRNGISTHGGPVEPGAAGRFPGHQRRVVGAFALGAMGLRKGPGVKF
ncbi:MAG: response regulator [Elusimicrobia bacterium]|nr:response regulator [Elusimicrobiota bacterium]